MPDYSQAKIYKITNKKNDIIYIGHTCQDLRRAMWEHRSYVNVAHRKGKWCNALHKAMHKLGKDNFKIKLIKQYPCESVDQVLIEVYNLMDQLIRLEMPLYNMHMYLWETDNTIRRPAEVKYDIHERKWCFVDLKDPSNPVEIAFSVEKYGYDLARYLAEVERECHYPCKKYGGKLPALEL